MCYGTFYKCTEFWLKYFGQIYNKKTFYGLGRGCPQVTKFEHVHGQSYEDSPLRTDKLTENQTETTENITFQ